MKANELMVDDWVMWKGKPVQVAGVSGVMYSFGQIDVTLAHCNDSGFLETHDIKSILPIPLTLEILENNGFERNLIWHHLDKDYGDFSVNVQLGYANKIEYIKINERGKDNVIPSERTKMYLTNIKYVHQLQHALKLCEIEKTIEL